VTSEMHFINIKEQKFPFILESFFTIL